MWSADGDGSAPDHKEKGLRFARFLTESSVRRIVPALNSYGIYAYGRRPNSTRQTGTAGPQRGEYPGGGLWARHYADVHFDQRV